MQSTNVMHIGNMIRLGSLDRVFLESVFQKRLQNFRQCK